MCSYVNPIIQVRLSWNCTESTSDFAYESFQKIDWYKLGKVKSEANSFHKVDDLNETLSLIKRKKQNFL